MADIEKKTATTKSKAIAIAKETIETVVWVLAMVIIIRFFLGEPRWIPSASMRPTLMEGDRLIIEKVSERFDKPHRGDILVFYPPFEQLDNSYWAKFTRLVGFFNKDTAYIKRVIGVPGDKIQIVDGKGVYINGKLLNEPYLYKSDYPEVHCSEFMNCGPMTVPPHFYFMMGDNRNDSQDSRYWGYLPEKRVIGKAWLRFWPLNRIGMVEHPKYNVTDPTLKNKPSNKDKNAKL